MLDLEKLDRRAHGDEDPSFGKGLVAGAVAGATAAFVMEKFQATIGPKLKSWIDEALPSGDGSEGGGGESSQPATVQAADKALMLVTGHGVPEAQKETAGEVAHFAMGTTTGAMYGVAAEVAPVVTMGHGVGFGTAVWAVADEAVVPALGLSKRPGNFPPSTHVYALASHIVYGVTAEITRRVVRRML